jgi:hypothetical protein
MTAIEPEDRDALRVQMQQAIETFRHQSTLFVQSAGFLIAADALLFGYGVAQKKAVPLLIASLTPLAIFIVLMLVLSHGLPVAYVAVSSEQRLLPKETTLAETYLMSKYPIAYSWIESAIKAGQNERNQMLANPPARGLLGTKALVVPLAIGSITQLALFFVAQFAFNYPFM